MILEVKQFPESQEVMDNPEWFMIASLEPSDSGIGNSAYARILDESEYILVEKTTADEHNKEWLDDGIHMHNKDRAKKFLNSLRGHLIVSQALTYGIKHLRALEDRKNKYPKDGEHAEPSNRADMEYIKEHLFPLYDIFNTD